MFFLFATMCAFDHGFSEIITMIDSLKICVLFVVTVHIFNIQFDHLFDETF